MTSVTAQADAFSLRNPAANKQFVFAF